MIKAEQDHKSNDSQSVRALTSGCVGSIGGALIRDLLDAEVTVRRGYTFQVTDDSVAVSNVSIGMVMGLEVRAVLKAPALDDLIRIEFEWEGRAIIQRLELNGILESKVWIKATVKAAVTVGLLFFDGEFELETEYQEYVPMIAVAGLAAALAFGMPLP
ncbi:hypothetical protein ACFQES_48250 [Nonomuraea salmonea]